MSRRSRTWVTVTPMVQPAKELTSAEWKRLSAARRAADKGSVELDHLEERWRARRLELVARSLRHAVGDDGARPASVEFAPGGPIAGVHLVPWTLKPAHISAALDAALGVAPPRNTLEYSSSSHGAFLRSRLAPAAALGSRGRMRHFPFPQPGGHHRRGARTMLSNRVRSSRHRSVRALGPRIIAAITSPATTPSQGAGDEARATLQSHPASWSGGDAPPSRPASCPASTVQLQHPSSHRGTSISHPHSSVLRENR